MEFRLTYEGPLFSTQRVPEDKQPDPRAKNKQHIRRVFHEQLKRLWEITPFLKTGDHGGPNVRVTSGSAPDPLRPIEELSKLFDMYGFNFVPLVTTNLKLICGLDILFLRPEPPGSVVQSGDIDNRIKTLLDALRIPTPNEAYADLVAEPDETPFFCLLEDDRLITKLAVETDTLLQDVGLDPDSRDARLVITVRLRPYAMNLYTLPFG